jgi:hypothetical protein
MGKFMTEHDLDVRTLRFMLPGVPVRFGGEIFWERDVVGIKGEAGNRTTFAVAESFKQRGEEVIDFPHTDENFPLGFVDPYVNSDENPLRVDQDLPPTPKLLTAPYSLEAPDMGVKDEPGQGDLVEKSDMLEYFIQYTVSIEPQKV